LDEVEELEMLLKHYVVTWAGRRGKQWKNIKKLWVLLPVMKALPAFMFDLSH